MPFFGKKEQSVLTVDIHSHLIPGIDDGAQSMDQSVDLVQKLSAVGIMKIITTPHIHPRYPNTQKRIQDGLELLKRELAQRDINIEIEAAAEYYVDETFHEKINQGEQLLTFGENYVLVEAPFQNKPMYFESVLFDLLSKGFRPVLAHPERYLFLEGSLEWLFELKGMDILLQLTIGSIGGYYGKTPQNIGVQLVKEGIIDFIGSDLHHSRHIEYLEKGLKHKEIQKLIRYRGVKNFDLL